MDQWYQENMPYILPLFFVGVITSMAVVALFIGLFVREITKKK